MKWNYLKGSEKDFEGAPEWATVIAEGEICAKAWELGSRWGSGIDGVYTEVSGGLAGLLSRDVIAQREPIITPKHLMIFGDPKSFIFAHDEATHAAKNKVTGEVVHTHIPGLINLSKFDFIAQRQLTDVTEDNLNECIGASEAINLNPDVVVRAGEINFNGSEHFMPLSDGINKLFIRECISKAVDKLASSQNEEVNIKVGSLHLDGKEHIAPLGNKYMREIAPDVWVDVYAVLKAWDVTNPALQHLIKKALQPGDRGHKTIEQDMQDIIDSAIRAKELEAGK